MKSKKWRKTKNSETLKHWSCSVKDYKQYNKVKKWKEWYLEIVEWES